MNFDGSESQAMKNVTKVIISDRLSFSIHRPYPLFILSLFVNLIQNVVLE